ncbi:MAG: hypothetical protein ACR2IJ_07240 [Fluviibacter sp.]
MLAELQQQSIVTTLLLMKRVVSAHHTQVSAILEREAGLAKVQERTVQSAAQDPA